MAMGILTTIIFNGNDLINVCLTHVENSMDNFMNVFNIAWFSPLIVGGGGCRRRFLASVSVSSLSVSSLNHLFERFGSADIVGYHIVDFHINTLK